MATYPVTDGVTTFLPPPEGYVVDFDNPQQQKAFHHFIIFGILGSLALFCLIQRLYTKHFLTAGLKIDDGTSDAEKKLDQRKRLANSDRHLQPWFVLLG